MGERQNEYAVVWTTDRGYFPGTNASLNAFEFYGNKADIFILTWGDFLSDEYKKQWPENVTFIPIDTSIYPGRDPGWYFVFMDFDFALRNLFDWYPVVLFWSADQCFLNNVMDFFEISRSTNRPILGTNEHGSHNRDFRSISKVWPYVHTWAVPYTDQPVFVPATNIEFLKKIMEYQFIPGNVIDRMDGLNYAIRDTQTRVLEVPGELWIQNVPYKFYLHEADKKIYFHESTTFLYAFHRKYWNSTICRQYLPAQPGTRQAEISRSNKMLFNRMYNFFNRECRVKWTENLEVWDGN